MTFDREPKKIKWSLSRKGFFFIGTTLLVQLAFFAWLAHLLQQSEFIEQKQFHSREVFGRANWLAALMSMNTLSAVSYAVTSDKNNSEVYNWTQKKIPAELNDLSAILTEPEDDTQKQQVTNVSNIWSKINQVTAAEIVGQSSDDADRLRSLRKTEPKLNQIWLELVKARSDALLQERTRVNTEQESPKSNRDLQKQILSIGVFISILAAIITFIQFSKRIAKRIDILTENTLRLAKAETLSPPIPGSDEIALLDHTFHNMAAELNAAKKQLEASERRMVTLIANMPVGLLTVDPGGRIEFANPACREMFVETDPTGTDLQSLLPLQPADLQLVLGQNNTANPIEITITKPGARPATLELSAKGITMAEGEKRLIMLQDVTQRHELETMKQEFLAMVSHDLRTPLSSIDLFLHLVQRLAYDSLPPAVRDNLSIAERSTKRLLNLVNDLLDIDKLQTGKLLMTFKTTAMSEIIEQSVNAVKNFADQRKVKIDIAENEIEIEADDERLIQVLVNLLSNAIKFSPDGSTVLISSVKDGDWAEVRVKDQGRGVPDSHKASIFEKYKQVEKSDSRRGVGTGLGLPICKAIIQQHGGEIGVESGGDAGSTFWFRIPLLQISTSNI